jgi:hypothetical protein
VNEDGADLVIDHAASDMSKHRLERKRQRVVGSPEHFRQSLTEF